MVWGVFGGGGCFGWSTHIFGIKLLVQYPEVLQPQQMFSPGPPISFNILWFCILQCIEFSYFNILRFSKLYIDVRHPLIYWGFASFNILSFCIHQYIEVFHSSICFEWIHKTVKYRIFTHVKRGSNIAIKNVLQVYLTRTTIFYAILAPKVRTSNAVRQ